MLRFWMLITLNATLSDLLSPFTFKPYPQHLTTHTPWVKALKSICIICIFYIAAWIRLLDWSHFLFYTDIAFSWCHHSWNYQRCDAFLRLPEKYFIKVNPRLPFLIFGNMHNCRVVLQLWTVPSEFPTGQTFILGVGTQRGGAENSIKHWKSDAARAQYVLFWQTHLSTACPSRDLTVRNNKYKLPQMVYFWAGR